MEKKNNLSFLLDFDLNNIDSNASSDSDTVGLLIDVSQVDNFNNAEKFRRQDDDTGFINEMEEEIERQLDAKAAKTNLTATNVKNILKHVISNEHVMAMVHNRLTRGEDDFIFEPKLTRAKAKELARIQPHISSTKKNTSAVHKLIQKEFSDDSSDEEYYPDQQSDDDKDGDNILDSDMDSQPSTPSMPQNISTLEQMDTSDLQYDNEGIFKIPSIPNALNEEESIGHRTRSKLCLSKTPLEQLEQAFIPPDITTDMYDWDWEPEDEYINFLKELYTQPLQKEINIEDDPEADPEYNILEDEETNTLDKEELREDKAVKISKKELKTLIAELDQFANNYTKEQQQQQLQKAPKKKKPSENSFVPLGDTSSGNPMIHLLPVLAEPKLPEFVSQSQCYLLSVQISQHVQLMAQQFVMTYKHPNFHKFSNICKNNLNSLSILAEKSNSKFIPQNFDDALKLITDWESKLSEPSFLKSYIKYIECETEYEKFAFNKKKKYSPTFHPELIKLMINSKALMYPKLLPQSFPSSLLSNGHQQYTPSEESLIVIGLEQFLPYVKSLCKKYSRDCDIFADAVKEVQKYLLPTKQVSGLIHYIKRCKLSKKNNLIKQFFDNGHVPKVNYCLLKKYELLPPINYPLNSLPLMWQNFIKNRDMLEEHVSLLKPNRLNMIDHKKFTLISQSKSLNHVNHHFRNPIINMLRHMPSLISPQKSETCSSSSNDSSIKNGIKSESDTVYNGNEQSCETTEFESMPTRLRMTTPRLAKIKSAQTNKTNEQTESAKGSSQRKIYSFDNNREKATSFSLRDNEDEIAELMLASTTIKKNTTNRKKTKQARELENLKKLLEAENSINKNERATKFAASFIQKVHVKLESKDPELFKAVLKIFLDYSEKLENPSQGDRTDYCLDERSPPFDKNSGQVMNQLNKYRDTVSVDLYKVICKKLHEYPDLCSDFLLFLTPQQASLIDKSVEHTMMLKMKEFVYITQMYFAKQPSRIAKVMQAMTQMASDPCITVANAHATMGIALKGHPLIMDMFLQILPTGKPPESLFAAHMYENLLCPVGPHDKNKAHHADAPELYENIELPVSTPQDDPYGGDGCKCDCHNQIEESKLKEINEHCASCGTRFLNGRIYLQTSEGLRPAKITFPGADNEKLENISRVSLKTIDQLVPCPPTRRRRKSSKYDSMSEECGAKLGLSKRSPAKDSEYNDRLRTKSKKGIKSPLKSTDQRKIPKIQTALMKGKREKRTEKKDTSSEQKVDYQNELYRVHDEFNEASNKFRESHDSLDDEKRISPINVSSMEKLNTSSDTDSSTNLEAEVIPWTMQEDKILLENVQKDYSKKTLIAVSILLKNRSVEQVKDRCKYLLSLIEKMT